MDHITFNETNFDCKQPFQLNLRNLDHYSYYELSKKSQIFKNSISLIIFRKQINLNYSYTNLKWHRNRRPNKYWWKAATRQYSLYMKPHWCNVERTSKGIYRTPELCCFWCLNNEFHEINWSCCISIWFNQLHCMYANCQNRSKNFISAL